MKHTLYALALLIALPHVALPADGRSGLPFLDPQRACDLMADQGLSTRGFREDSDAFTCRSQRRALSGGGQPRHTVHYRALGSGGTVERLRLELQINSTSGVQRAHRQLADRAQVLFERALDRDLPEAIEAAILGAVQGAWPINGHLVTLERITAGTPHHELRLTIE